nr:hypothetical protein [Acidobacteriota bacterium]
VNNSLFQLETANFYNQNSAAIKNNAGGNKTLQKPQSFPVEPKISIKTIVGEDPRELHKRFLLEAASQAGLDGTDEQKQFVEKFLTGVRFATVKDDPSKDDGLSVKSSDIKGEYLNYKLNPQEINALHGLQASYRKNGGKLHAGKIYDTSTQGRTLTAAEQRGGKRGITAEQYERWKMRDLYEKAQITPSSIFGTPSKLRDLKHVVLNAPEDGGQVDTERALRLYVRERYGDRLLADSREELVSIAKNRGIKVGNLEPKNENGKIEFDISVENLLKLHHAYIGVQEKVNAELDAAQKTIDGLAHNRFAKGVVEGAWADLKDNWNMVSSPIETVKGLYEAAKTIGNVGLKLAQMEPDERAKLFSDLAKAGVKGLAEMPIGDAAEHLGNIVGRIAVEAALGKSVAVVFKALSASKIGAEILQETVKLGKGIKETVGKVPIPTNAGVKVLTDTLGNKMVFPDFELTKLEDIVKMMKSSDEGLTMLKNGSTAGTKAIKEVAESGLSETAQSGLKALRGTLSKEGLAKAKEQLVTLSVARTELLARLDNLIKHGNLLPDTKEFLSRSKNSLLKNLKQDDLVGALRDIFGKDVRRSGDGYIYQHAKEVNQGLTSLNNAKDVLVKELKRTTQGSQEYNRLSQEIDAVKEMTRRINIFLEIK